MKPRGSAETSTSRDRAITNAIEAWFRAHARELPWRTGVTDRAGWRRDPYRALVSEAMLQQTQVCRVTPKFESFIARFPTVESLAEASEHDVLTMWAGLGYYRRARNLHAAAKQVVRECDGQVPREVEALRRLPGVGAYTAGAVASMAGNVRTPLVDGNVARVLLRIDGREGRVGERASLNWAWARAAELVSGCGDAGVFNEGVMELGGLVCVPGTPRCEACPVRGVCRAREQGRAHLIPQPKQAAARARVCCDSVVVMDRRGRVLMVQRGEAGMWSKMWQAPTLEKPGKHASRAKVREMVSGLVADAGGGGAMVMHRVGEFRHTTSHREMMFRVWVARVDSTGRASGRRTTDSPCVLSLSAATKLPISNAQRRVLELARER